MFGQFSIKSKLLMLFIAVTTLVLATAFVIMMTLNIKNSKNDITSVLDIVGKILADRCAVSLAFSDVESANSNLRTLSSHGSVVYACIRTNDNQLFSEYTKNVENIYKCNDYSPDARNDFRGGYVDSIRPVMLEGRSIGSLQIKASLDEFRESVLQAIKISMIVFVGLIVVASMVSMRIMNMITSPITSLKDLAQKVTMSKDYSLRMGVGSSDEVGVLVSSFNTMLDQIQERDSALIEEKNKAEKSAQSAKKYAKETELINLDLENEIRERARIEEELQELNETLEEKVNERTAELKEINEKIGEISRSAGMAEVASGVLHNVGNVLNSVNVSFSMIREQLRKTKATNLTRLVGMIRENSGNIGEYISKDEKGRQIPRFIELLDEQLRIERETMFNELDVLSNSIDHIKNVISMQQSYAGGYGVRERVSMAELVEDAVKINMEDIVRRGIEVIRNYGVAPLIYIDKHKALQILINIISNAKYAVLDSPQSEKKIIVDVSVCDNEIVVQIGDTGVGISKEDIPHLFEYGFKKRRDGHGYGLHHSALVANELGGKITVYSEGPGKGAVFRFLVPVYESSEL